MIVVVGGGGGVRINSSLLFRTCWVSNDPVSAAFSLLPVSLSLTSLLRRVIIFSLPGFSLLGPRYRAPTSPMYIYSNYSSPRDSYNTSEEFCVLYYPNNFSCEFLIKNSDKYMFNNFILQETNTKLSIQLIIYQEIKMRKKSGNNTKQGTQTRYKYSYHAFMNSV